MTQLSFLCDVIGWVLFDVMCSNTSATEVLLPGHFRDCGSTVIGESSSTSPSSTKCETPTPLLGIPQKIPKVYYALGSEALYNERFRLHEFLF